MKSATSKIISHTRNTWQNEIFPFYIESTTYFILYVYSLQNVPESIKDEPKNGRRLKGKRSTIHFYNMAKASWYLIWSKSSF